MSPRFAANTGIGADASAALPAGGEVLPRPPAGQLAMDRPQRVRALGRATRSANGSGCWQSEPTVKSLTRQSPHARRRAAENRLQFAAGGPGPLTEDRQKPQTRCAQVAGGAPCCSEGMHGTRNTVPSIAAVEVRSCLPLGSLQLP
jgi:hypothetical protein